MTDQDQRVRENRLRRWAERLGLEISKSRARTFKVNDRGGWQVLEDGEVLAGERFELDLGTLEKALALAETLRVRGVATEARRDAIRHITERASDEEGGAA